MTRWFTVPIAALVVVLASGPGYAQQRGFNLQATPQGQGSVLLPLPPAPPRIRPPSSGPSYDPAPTPNRDLDAPVGPRASNAPELAPGLFTRGQQYRGDGYSAGSSAQSEQERRARPGAGFKLRMPLQQQ